MLKPSAAMDERYGLKGQNALVTGGTKGIGRAIVEELAVFGAQVFTCARSAEDVDALVQEYKRRGLAVEGMAADLATCEGRQELMKKVETLFGGVLHILVNNVGTNVRGTPTVEYTTSDYDFVMNTNLTSAFHLTQLAHPLLKAGATPDRTTSVVMLSSVAGGPTAIKSGSIYAMTKAAMDQLAKNLACEWASDGIRINSVKPWYIATPLAAPVLEDKVLLASVEERTPMRRVGQPEEISGLVVFLCSKAASYITGQGISVDGGFSVLGWY